jgi:hypothetical protein
MRVVMHGREATCSAVSQSAAGVHVGDHWRALAWRSRIARWVSPMIVDGRSL